MLKLSEQLYARVVSNTRAGVNDMADGELHIPVENFVSEARAAAELDVIRSMPIIVAHGSELPKPGSFVTKDVLGSPLLIVRQDNGSVSTFYNACKHRGGKVELDESGNKRVFTCRYHGWSYGRRGDLRGVPYEKAYGAVDRSCNSLTSIQSEERHKLIWLDFANQADRSVADYLGPELDKQFAAYGRGESIVYCEKVFDLDVNWKLVIDGALDTLHPQFLHPNTVGKLINTSGAIWEPYGRHGMNVQARMKLAELIKAGEDVSGAQKLCASATFVYPNSIAIPQPDHLECWTVMPTGSPSKSKVTIRFIVDGAKLDDRMKGRLQKSWEILSAAICDEDFPMEATIQENANANPTGTYLYGRGEIACQHLHRFLEKDIESASVSK